jgi:hypothetical protein
MNANIKVVTVSKPGIRLLATDIDGTLLNPQFQISPCDLDGPAAGACGGD